MKKFDIFTFFAFHMYMGFLKFKSKVISKVISHIWSNIWFTVNVKIGFIKKLWLLSNLVVITKCPTLTLVQQVEKCYRGVEQSINALYRTIDPFASFEPGSTGLMSSIEKVWFRLSDVLRFTICVSKTKFESIMIENATMCDCVHD